MKLTEEKIIMSAHLSKAIKSTNVIRATRARRNHEKPWERITKSREMKLFPPNLITDIYPSFLCVNFLLLFTTSATFCEEIPRNNNKKVTLRLSFNPSCFVALFSTFAQVSRLHPFLIFPKIT
jgi:hypothetical protein